MATLTPRPHLYGDEQTRDITTIIDAQRDEVAAAATALLTPIWPEGQPLPDYAAAQDGNKILLLDANGNVFTKQQGLQTAKAERKNASASCTQATTALNSVLRRQGRLVLEHHGEEAVRTLGLDKKTESRRTAASSHGKQILSRMRPHVESGFEALEGTTALDMATEVATLEKAVSTLDNGLKRLDEAKTAVKVQRAAYKQALRRFRQVRKSVVDFQESLFTLVGREDLAKSLRPALRPMSRRPGEEESTTEGEGDPPQESLVVVEPVSS